MPPTFRTGGGPEREAAAQAVHQANFLDDPVMHWIFCGVSEEQRRRAVSIPRLVTAMVRAAAVQGGIFDEAWIADDDADADGTTTTTTPAASVIWMRPGTSAFDPRYFLPAGMFGLAYAAGPGAVKRIVLDYGWQVEKAKRAGLRWPDSHPKKAGQPITTYYYMHIVSTMQEHRGRGLSSELIRRFQTVATAEQIPIWTEASTERSHRLYVALGFRDVATLTLGPGIVDSRGFPAKGGAGVQSWCVLWTPEPLAE